MRPLTKQTIVISPENPWNSDPFGRKEKGEQLTRFAKFTYQGAVVALKAPWGSGKTTFLRRWQYDLTLQGIPNIYFDAWAFDQFDDPIHGLLTAAEVLKQSEVSTALRIGKSLKKLWRMGLKVAMPVMRTVIAAKTSGASEAVVATTEMIDSVVESTDQRLTSVELGNQFKQELEELADIVRPVAADTTIPRPPLIIIIDELDRCRPDFSVKLLERIKHYFEIEGILFVLATDGACLPAAIRSIQGPDVDGDAYLRKIVDFEFRLSSPEPGVGAFQFFRDAGFVDEFENAGLRQVTNIAALVEVDTEFLSTRDSERLRAIISLSIWSFRFSLSLRDIAQVASSITLIFRARAQNYFAAEFLSLLLCIKHFASKKYEQLVAAVNEPNSFTQLLLEVDKLSDKDYKSEAKPWMWECFDHHSYLLRFGAQVLPMSAKDAQGYVANRLARKDGDVPGKLRAINDIERMMRLHKGPHNKFLNELLS